jgi:WD40 repeat protein
MKRLSGLWESSRAPEIRRILDEAIPRPGDAAPDLRGAEWYAWDRRLQDDLGAVLTVKDPYGVNFVHCLALSPDDRFLTAMISASNPSKRNSLLILWDLHTREVVRTFSVPGHFNQTDDPAFDSNVAFSPDGKLLGVCSYSGSFSAQNRTGCLYVWDVETGEQRFAILKDERIGGRSLIFSPDSKSIIAGGFEAGWLSWSLEAGAAAPPIEFADRRSKTTNATMIGLSQKPIRDRNAVFDLRFYLWDKGHLVSASPGAPPTISAWPKGEQMNPNPGYGMPAAERIQACLLCSTTAAPRSL